jgi:hypothetical protein
MTTALVNTVVDTPMDFTVFAQSPKEMETAQRSLILWAARKIQMVKNEIEEARSQFKLHQDNKWNTAGWRAQILKQERRAEFYRKIKMALEAGYYIVPPFPMDIFAIRTKRAKPHEYLGRHRDNHNQPAQALPAGEGRYVNPRPVREKSDDPEMRGEKEVMVTHYFATEYQDVDFPFKLARAEIRSLADNAMKLKIFDRLGILPRVRNPDPIICGQIIVPNQLSYRMGQHGDPQVINFFVAWWLDTKTL